MLLQKVPSHIIEGVLNTTIEYCKSKASNKQRFQNPSINKSVWSHQLEKEIVQIFIISVKKCSRVLL